MEDEHHFLRFGLVGVFLIAVLAILGMVALITSGTPTSLPQLAHGVAPVSAQQEGGNLAGDAMTLPRLDTHVYLGYDAQGHALLFTDAARKAGVRVPLSLEGNGVLAHAGKTYLVRADASGQDMDGGVGIAIDTDADMQHDRKAMPGTSFTLS